MRKSTVVIVCVIWTRDGGDVFCSHNNGVYCNDRICDSFCLASVLYVLDYGEWNPSFYVMWSNKYHVITGDHIVMCMIFVVFLGTVYIWVFLLLLSLKSVFNDDKSLVFNVGRCCRFS